MIATALDVIAFGNDTSSRLTAAVNDTGAAAVAAASAPSAPPSSAPNDSAASGVIQSFLDDDLSFPGYIRTTCMVVCVIILGVGVVGNMMVPIVILKSKDMRNSTNIFLMNLSIADLMVLLICTPTVFVEVNSKPETWVLGEELCEYHSTLSLTPVVQRWYITRCTPRLVRDATVIIRNDIVKSLFLNNHEKNPSLYEKTSIFAARTSPCRIYGFFSRLNGPTVFRACRTHADHRPRLGFSGDNY